MQAYQERVVQEKKELDDKIDKLNTFSKVGFFQILPSAEQLRLSYQLEAMRVYSSILNERIENFI